MGLLEVHPTEDIIVTNGDLITDISYTKLLEFHSSNNAEATMAVRPYEMQNPFGEVQTKGIDIVAFEEKPIYHSYVNAGVYVLSPGALRDIPGNVYYDMPSLFEGLNTQSRRAIVYPMHEPWLDIGGPKDLMQARNLKNETSVAEI